MGVVEPFVRGFSVAGVDVKGEFPLGPISILLLVVIKAGKVTHGTSGGWISMLLKFMSCLWGLAPSSQLHG